MPGCRDLGRRIWNAAYECERAYDCRQMRLLTFDRALGSWRSGLMMNVVSGESLNRTKMTMKNHHSSERSFYVMFGYVSSGY